MATQSSAFARHQVKALFLMLATEEWRDVVGWERVAEVSNHGRIRSKARQVSTGRSGGTKWVGGSLRKQHQTNGYSTIRLHDHGRATTALVHVLVLTAFDCPRPDGLEACHNNGVRSDARLFNLRWDTTANNRADQYKHGTLLVGAKNPFSKLRESQVARIKRLLSEGEDQPVIASQFGVTASAISKIATGKNWGHINAEPA